MLQQTDKAQLSEHNGTSKNNSKIGFGEGQIIDPWKIILVLKRWIYLILAIVFLGVVSSAYFVNRLTPIYSAATTLEVKQEERNILEVSNVENVIANSEFLRTQIELLKSTSLFQNVVSDLNLVSDKEFIPDTEEFLSLDREDKTRIAVNRLRDALTVSSVGRSRLIRVRFEHSNPQKAALIANTVAETFISNSLTRKFNSTQYASDFLEDRLESVRRSLENAERELVNYASDGSITSTVEIGSDGGQSLDRLALVSIDKERTNAYIRRLEAETELKSWKNSSSKGLTLVNPVISNLKQIRTDLQDEYIERRSIFKPSYPDMLELQSRIDEIDRQIAAEETNINSTEVERLEREFLVAKNQEDLLTDRVTQLTTKVNETSVKSINLSILQRQVDSERSQYDALLQRLKEITVSGQIAESLVQVVDEAIAPQFPSKPNKFRLIALAFLLSISLSLGLVYLIEIIDDRIKNPNDLRTKLDLNVLGVIPRVRADENEIIEYLSDSTSDFSEAYASLRANVQFLSDGPQVIQVTSARPSEGKSTTAMGMAFSFAALDGRVLLIDCDIRYPTFSRQEKKTKGMTGLLTSSDPLTKHVLLSKYSANLDILTAGRKVDNPTEILSHPRFREILEEARKNYRFIILDSPPVLGLADAPIIGASVDGVVFVVENNRLRTPNILASLERLRKSGTKIIGGVLSKFKANSINYYYYDYSGGYGYGKESSSDDSYDFTNGEDSAHTSNRKVKINLVS